MKLFLSILLSFGSCIAFAQTATPSNASIEPCAEAALEAEFVYLGPIQRQAKNLLRQSTRLSESTLAPPTLSPGDLANAKNAVTAKVGVCLEGIYPFADVQAAIIKWAKLGHPVGATPPELKDLGEYLITLANRANGLNEVGTSGALVLNILQSSGLSDDIKAGRYKSVDDPALSDIVKQIGLQVVAPAEASGLIVWTLDYFSQLPVDQMAGYKSWAEIVNAAM